MKYEFRKTPNSVRPYATLIIDDDEFELDEEICWIAEIINCQNYERI